MLEHYKEVTKKSKADWDRSRRIFPGGMSHNIRTFGLDRVHVYPPFIQRGDGSHIWDVDGNEYIDYWMTHFSLILGHNYPAIRKAILGRLDYGVHLGALNEPQIEFGELLQDAIPYMKLLRLTTTGSDATMYSTRLCRLFTGKKLVAKVNGGWHGGNDSLCYHLHYPYKDEPFFTGAYFEFNDRNSFDSLLKAHGKELAAIIIEPVLGAGGGLAPEPEFLPYLREETENHDILLIFDEIITGFRLCFGTAGNRIYGVEPDLVTLGKIVAGGMPLGVYGGREDVMKLAAPGAPSGRWVGGGTFSAHHLTMESGKATLNALKANKDEYSQLNRRGNKFREEITAIFNDEGIPALATGEGSIAFLHLLKSPLTDKYLTPSQIGEVFDKERTDLLQATLVEEGIFGYHGLGALSFAHSEADIQHTLEVVQRIAPNFKAHTD
ncbi:MAG: aspartate aminotransferase family protein [Promethearchaeota archaeon]